MIQFFKAFWLSPRPHLLAPDAPRPPSPPAFFRSFGRPEEIFGMHEVEYYKRNCSYSSFFAKDVLFARHNSSIRQVDKNKLWRQIHAELTAHWAVLKDAAYVRDRAWDNLKSTAIKKNVHVCFIAFLWANFSKPFDFPPGPIGPIF